MDTITLTVRDRRKSKQFSIENKIIDDWFLIIGVHGFALYALYCRMANKTDERSYPGYAYIKRKTGMGSATISNYNKLLTWCGLIYINSGSSTKSNEYFILDVLDINYEMIQNIFNQVTYSNQDNSFTRNVLNRLNQWQLNDKINNRVTTISTSTALSQANTPLSQANTPLSQANTPLSQANTPIRLGKSNNPNTTTTNNKSKNSQAVVAVDPIDNDSLSTTTADINLLLKNQGIGQPMRGKILDMEHITLEYVQAHIEYAQLKKLDIGLLITRLQGDPMPEISQPMKLSEQIPSDLAHIIKR